MSRLQVASATTTDRARAALLSQLRAATTEREQDRLYRLLAVMDR
jgi:hypothetical protein